MAKPSGGSEKKPPQNAKVSSKKTKTKKEGISFSSDMPKEQADVVVSQRDNTNDPEHTVALPTKGKAQKATPPAEPPRMAEVQAVGKAPVSVKASSKGESRSTEGDTKKAKSSEKAEIELPRSWRWVLGFVGVLLAIHVIVPGMYYFHDSPTARADERFRWRMFSTVRMRRCVAEAFERKATANGVLQQQKISLVREVQYAWINLMHRGRPQVVEAFLRQRCAKKAAEQVEVRQYCRDVKGVPLFVLEWDLACKGGKIRQTYRPLGQVGS